MPTVVCPNCRLINPDGADTCDCGWSFATGELRQGAQAQREILIGDASKRRLFAASIDNLVAMFLGLLAASRMPMEAESGALLASALVYLGYFLVQEGSWSNTLGKRLFGLRICRLDGSRSGWDTAFIRTGTRIVEVNPVVFGGLPAALVGAFSRRHQRLGDMFAGSLVVRATHE